MLIRVGAMGGMNWQDTAKFFKEHYSVLYSSQWLVGLAAIHGS